MKKFISCVVSIVIFQLAFASTDPVDSGKIVHASKMVSHFAARFDACMDQYNQQSQLNEWMYSYMLYNCYEMFQFPYSTACHSEAILNWSSAQDMIFEQLMYCQNGSSG